MFSLQGILLLVVGVAVGILGGAMPGISSTMTVALISTMTYGMEPLPAITLLAACAVGSTYGGSISCAEYPRYTGFRCYRYGGKSSDPARAWIYGAEY